MDFGLGFTVEVFYNPSTFMPAHRARALVTPPHNVTFRVFFSRVQGLGAFREIGRYNQVVRDKKMANEMEEG